MKRKRSVFFFKMPITVFGHKFPPPHCTGIQKPRYRRARAAYSPNVELMFFNVGHIFHSPMRNAAAVYASEPGTRYGSRVVTHEPVTNPVTSMARDATPNATLVRDTFSGARLTAHIPSATPPRCSACPAHATLFQPPRTGEEQE